MCFKKDEWLMKMDYILRVMDLVNVILKVTKLISV